MMVQSSILDTLYNNPLHTHTNQKKKKNQINLTKISQIFLPSQI